MARDNKIHMPQSTAGITRYFDEYKGKVSIKPQVVIVLIVLVIVLVLAIRAFFGGAIA